MKKVKMMPVKFTYNMEAVSKAMANWNGVKSARFVRLTDGGAMFSVRGNKYDCTNADICKALGGEGGYYNGGDYIEPRIKWNVTKKGITVSVWRKILTKDEMEEFFREHNKGFSDKGNPVVYIGVKVYSPALSHWQRFLWNCDFIDRAYRVFSNAEVYREKDPSAGMCRHPHNAHMTLRGNGNRCEGGECLLREPEGWVCEYCYIEGKVNKSAK